MLIVKKFVGTSLANRERILHVAKRCKKEYEKGNDVVVVLSAMGDVTDQLIDKAKEINETPSEREMDMLFTIGEQMSVALMAMALEGLGVPAVSLNAFQAKIHTTSVHGDAKITHIETERMREELAQKKIVIVTGFQGIDENDDYTTLGRGGSDTSAVAIGKALGSDLVQIYTDVDGIMTADPRIEPDAKVLKYVDYDEVFQMAEKGAKVIHPRAVELAKNADIILQIKNTYNPNYEGTKIGPANVLKDVYEDSSKVKFMSAVAHKDKIAQVKVIATEDIFSRILNEMEDRHINMDMINFFTEKKAFALDVSNLEEVENILKQYDVEYEIKPDCAKVTLIGNKVTETPGVIAKIMRALNAENVTLLQSSDSYNSWSCLVDEKDMVTTVHVIHTAFSV